MTRRVADIIIDISVEQVDRLFTALLLLIICICMYNAARFAAIL